MGIVISRKEAIESGALRYFTGKPCKNGHVAERHVVDRGCMRCNCERTNRANKTPEGRERRKRWRQTPKAKQGDRAYRAKPEAKLKAAAAQTRYLQTDKGRRNRRALERARSRERSKSVGYREWYRGWKRSYEKAPKVRSRVLAYRKSKRTSDPIFKLACNLRARLWHALRNKAKRGSAVRLLGCSPEEACRHIERQFKLSMSWDNWGAGLNGDREWHVDHINPLASFDLTDPEQLAQACHYTNLQPLWADDNRQKKARLQWAS